MPLGQRVAYAGRVLEVGRGVVVPTGEVLSRLVDTFSREAEGLLDARVRWPDGREEVFSATPEHPFYVEGEWTALWRLQPGALLSTGDGGTAQLLRVVERRSPVRVYNFEVEADEEHSYLVGREGSLLAHNGYGCYVIKFTNDCIYIGKGDAKRMMKSLRKKLKELKKSGVGLGSYVHHGATSAIESFELEGYMMSLYGWMDPASKQCFLNILSSPGLGKYDWRR